MRKSRLFRLKKWLLVVVTSLGTFLSGIILAILITLIVVINPLNGAFQDGMGANGQREFSRTVSYSCF